MTRRALSLALGLLLLGVLPAPAQDALSLDDLRERYAELGGLRASFTQVMGSEFADDSTRIRGEVLLDGNRYRVETPAQTVVTNGETTWIYSPADSQVVVNDAESAESTVTPQSFLTSSAETYEISSQHSDTRDGVAHSVLALASTDRSSRFTDVTLWVRNRDLVVTRLRASDRNGSTLDLRLHDIEINPPLADDHFVFALPEGVEVVDLRSGASD